MLHLPLEELGYLCVHDTERPSEARTKSDTCNQATRHLVNYDDIYMIASNKILITLTKIDHYV